MECVMQCEIDSNCRKLLDAKWPDVPKWDDVRSLHVERGSVDLICGGFPCQNLSVAGKREGLAGERSGLWFEYLRILDETRPEWVVIENVPGLLSSNGGRDFAVVLRGLVELRYRCAWRVLDAQHWGVPQRRRRVFIVGHLGASGRAAEVLFESEGVPGDTETGGKAGEDVAGVVAFEPGNLRRRCGSEPNSGTFPTLGAESQGDKFPCIAGTLHKAERGAASGTNSVPTIARQLRAQSQLAHREDMDTLVTGTVSGKWAKGTGGPAGDEAQNLVTHALTAEGSDASEDGTGRGTPLVAAYNIQNNTLQQQGINGIISKEDIYASTQETDTSKVLSVLRKSIGEEAFTEWGLGVLVSLQPSEILRKGLHGESVRREASEAGSLLGNSPSSLKENDTAGSVPEVRKGRCHRRSPLGRELPKQHTRELEAFVSKLSCTGAQQEEALRDLWDASEGIGVLRQALSAIQETRRSPNDPNPEAQKVPCVRKHGEREGAVREALHAGKEKGGIGVMSVRRLTPL